ncbi:uncharacterized protein LOC125947193 [Dermacentor silvarum]|uniref:uncharacterized protein LOC125947193 n=1 Tax=Dermacentor silvarum TaxID=543639 RepID=UPI002100C89F|nr:uncharacterized protein LOC125947193 [Dermacentor silvarum]
MPPRRVPHALREPLRKELARIKAAGIIAKITEPTDWFDVSQYVPGKQLILADTLSRIQGAAAHSRDPDQDDVTVHAANVLSVLVSDNMKSLLASATGEDAELNPYCVRPPFGSGWPPAFEQPSSEDIFQSAPPAHDSGTSGLSWLRNIGVGMLVAAMLTVALTLALNMDLQDSDVVPWPTSPMPGEMEKIGSGRIAIPVRPIIVPPGRRPGATFRPISEAHNVTRAPRLAARAEPSRLPWPYADNKTLSHQCGSHFYTYCYEGGNDVYYSATLRTCTSTEAGSVHVCNRGANRFTSMDSCLASCVHVANGRPQDRCYEATLFATCSWQDAAETWWYYDGTVCAQWNFPLGNCPLQDGRLFRTRLDCDQACVHREGGDGERRRCDAPDAATCTTRQLKYPYFASMRESGPARCVSASSHELNAHRCLVGPNRFDSVASCERACVDS